MLHYNMMKLYSTCAVGRSV